MNAIAKRLNLKRSLWHPLARRVNKIFQGDQKAIQQGRRRSQHRRCTRWGYIEDAGETRTNLAVLFHHPFNDNGTSQG
jgi:hypothetical protein